MKELKTIIKYLGMSIWILGGGMLVASILIGLPVLAIILITEETLTWLWNYVPEIIIVVAVALVLIWGLTEKVNDPLHY